MSRIIALVDCDCFYVSVQRVFDPGLEGRPVVILSNNDGCIVARSSEAKKLGIAMGVPLFKVRALLERHQVQVYSSNYTLAGDLSSRVMAVLAEFTPTWEAYSIDEWFLDLSGFTHQSLTDYCRQIRATVRQRTGIPVSIGVGSSKVMAKIATEIAKDHPELAGVFNLIDHPEPDRVLADIKIENVWGIGRQYSKFLRTHGIQSALQLRDANEDWIRQHMGVVGVRLVMELRGISCMPLDLNPAPRKSIIRSRSFGRPVTSLRELEESVATYLSRAAEKLREERLAATNVTVFILTNPFGNTPFYSKSAMASLPVATNDTPELVHYALAITRSIYHPGYAYKKSGVILLGLVPVDQCQPNFFDQRDRERSAQLMTVMDQLNSRFGSGTLRVAAAGLVKPWAMSSARRSLRYTTRWAEIPVVKA